MLRRLRQGDLLAALFLLALVTIFLGRVTLGGKALLPIDNLFSFPPWSAYAAQFGITVPHNELIGDMILQNYSWKSFAKESYHNGAFPLWNPYIFCGMPFLAAGQYAALYPLGILFYILPVAQAYGWFALLHLFLGGLFMYLYVKLIGVGRWGALVSAVSFMLCGFIIVSFVWPMIVSTVIWLPLLLAIIEVIVRRFEQEQQRDSGLLSSCALWVPLGGVVVEAFADLELAGDGLAAVAVVMRLADEFGFSHEVPRNGKLRYLNRFYQFGGGLLPLGFVKAPKAERPPQSQRRTRAL